MKFLFIVMVLFSTLLGSIGEVTALKGNAQLSREATITDVNKGLKIDENDLLITEVSSKVQVILNDHTVVTIGPKSEYLFERFVEEGNPEVVMRLNHGFFKVITGKIGKVAPERFTIKTRAAVIGIRGTQFMAHVEVDEEKIGCTQGSITITTQETIYEIQRGEMLVYKNEQWQKKELDAEAFTPVTAGASEKEKQQQAWEKLPGIENEQLLQEQTVNDHQPLL